MAQNVGDRDLMASGAFSVNVSALTKIADQMRARQANIGPALQQGMTVAMARLAAYIQQTKLSGQVLHQRSGRLSQSVGHPTVTQESNTRVTGFIGGAWYGRVHEFGATIHVNSPVMLKGIGWRYLKTVTLPPRPWLNPSIQEQSPMIAAQVVSAVQQALRE